MNVNHTPRGSYFGNADNCDIIIYNLHYNQLAERGSCGDRFCSGEGKVTISIK